MPGHSSLPGPRDLKRALDHPTYRRHTRAPNFTTHELMSMQLPLLILMTSQRASADRVRLRPVEIERGSE